MRTSIHCHCARESHSEKRMLSLPWEWKGWSKGRPEGRRKLRWPRKLVSWAWPTPGFRWSESPLDMKWQCDVNKEGLMGHNGLALHDSGATCRKPNDQGGCRMETLTVPPVRSGREIAWLQISFRCIYIHQTVLHKDSYFLLKNKRRLCTVPANVRTRKKGLWERGVLCILHCPLYCHKKAWGWAPSFSLASCCVACALSFLGFVLFYLATVICLRATGQCLVQDCQVGFIILNSNPLQLATWGPVSGHAPIPGQI